MAEEVGLPKAPVQQLLSAALPSDVKLSADARELFSACCTEFVQLVASEAQERCEAAPAAKGAVGPEHVGDALTALGFPLLAPGVASAVEVWKAEDRDASARRAKGKGRGGGLTEEEAAAAQAALFADARSKLYGS